MKKTILSNGPLETKKLATEIREYLQNGDVILLKGEIGAGKSHFARSLIQAAMDKVEEVPSPTFTLVQTYDTKIGSIWHADLYRLSDQSEIFELGLIDAFGKEIVLVEWPSVKHAQDFYNSSEYQNAMKYLNDDVSERYFNLAASILLSIFS